jgi:hypothetical protein
MIKILDILKPIILAYVRPFYEMAWYNDDIRKDLLKAFRA